MLLTFTGVALATSVNEVEPNDSFSQAQSLDGSFSLDYDANIGNTQGNTSTTVPHATAVGTGNGTYDYYKFTVAEGEQLNIGVFDIDGAMYSFDPILHLYDSNGTRLQRNDDSRYVDPGSVHRFDSYMEHEFSRGGTYYIQVGQYYDSPIPNGASYKLHVSIGNPAPSVILAPELTLPSDITQEATGANGAAVSYTATDNVDGSVSVNCSPASGSTFALGTTQVTCSATDEAGNEATGSFNVTIEDNTAPEISNVPSDISKTATSSSGATATYTSPTASDLVDGTVSVSCSPASGSTFALGSTTVNCSASDSRNNTANASFKVNVTYSWSGVLQPINGGSTASTSDDDSVFKLGSTVPVKFRLTGDSAGITDAMAKLYVSKVSNGVAGNEVEAGSTAASTSGNLFRYDTQSDQYIFNWGTKGLNTGTGTYSLRIELGDGTTKSFRQ